MNRIGYRPALAFVLGVAVVLTGCNSKTGVYSIAGSTSLQESPPASTQPPSAPGKSVTVSWDANRERGVNSAGGGYRVYYSRTAIDSNSPFVTVPFAAPKTPSTALLSGLAAGTYTIRVVAFSAANSTGSTGTQATVVVP